MSRLTKDQIDQYKQYFIDYISAEDYNHKELKTDKEKLQFVFDCFYSEYWHWNKKRNIQAVFAEYLSGLPSCVNIVFMNYDILQLVEKINGKLTEKQEDRIIENYWNFMSSIFFKLVKQYKINIYV